MNKVKSFPVFSSIEQFEAAYCYVKEGVCLFSPKSGKLIAANLAFWNSLGLTERAEEVVLLNVEELPEEGDCETIWIQFGKKQQKKPMFVCPGGLNEAMVKLGILNLNVAQEDKEYHLKIAETEKKALLNEVYHRVKNNLNIIISLLSLQINRISDPGTRLLLLESKSRIFTLSLLQQNLYSSPHISEIEAGAYLRSLATSVLSTFKEKEKSIRLVAETEEGWLDIDILTPLGLIAHELLSNAALHAFSDEESGVINLRFQELQEDLFHLQVSDNGKGLPQGSDVRECTTLGFQMIRSLGKQLNARLEIKSDPSLGTSVIVEFKRSGK